MSLSKSSNPDSPKKDPTSEAIKEFMDTFSSKGLMTKLEISCNGSQTIGIRATIDLVGQVKTQHHQEILRSQVDMMPFALKIAINKLKEELGLKEDEVEGI